MNGQDAPRLRVAAVVDSTVVAAWQHEVIERVRAAPSLDLVLVVSIDESPPERSRSLFGLYERLDYRHYRVAEDALARVEVPEAVRGLPEQAIRDAEPDVVLRFSADRLSEAVAPRYGVWSLREDDRLFYDVYEGRGLVEVVVEMSRPGEPARAVFSSTTRAQPLSLYRNRNVAYWVAAEGIVSRLLTLERLGPAGLDSIPSRDRALPPAPGDGSTPRNGVVARQMVRTVAREVRHRWRARFASERWSVAWRPGTGTPGSSNADFTALPALPGRFYADPFLLERDSRHYMFFEDYGYGDGRGRISFVELDSSRGASEPGVALERPYHLSYPFVFESGGEVFMLPETAGRRTVELYRAHRFPADWQLERVLMDGIHAVDSTILWHGDRFWLFALVNPHGLRAHSELFLYWSPSLDGEWTPHPLNPVVSDARCARPAGRVIERAGRLLRPGQDNLKRYGWAIAFNEVEALSESEYRESPAGRLEPQDALPGSLATHTYDCDGTYEVVDALMPSGRSLRRRARLR